MAQLLKQSTAFTFRAGQFLDSTDLSTPEVGLTINQADIQISKNGGAFAQTSASPTASHDVDGFYQCPLTATDTGTLGPLRVQITVSGARTVVEDFMVVPANVYDSLVGGSDTLQSDVTQINGQATPEGGYTPVQLMRLMASVLLGKSSGGGTGTEVYRDLSDTKDRVSATVSSEGNRTAVSRTAT